jgi:integrase
MASVRKRSWTAPDGTTRQAWQCDYRDAAGKRRSKQFDKKKDADAFATKAGYEVSQGIHTPDAVSITVEQAGKNWIARGERERLEQSTLNMYEQHLRLHINPFLGAKRLNQLTKPMIEDYRDDLLDSGRSRAMTRKILGSLSSLVKEAQRKGHVAQNVAEDVTAKRSSRDKQKIVPPSKEHMRAMFAAAERLRPMDHPLLMVLIFAGLRASEARALPWSNVDLKRGLITIDRRADFKNVIGPPKSASGHRTIPVGPKVVQALKVWKLRCPVSDADLVFPSDSGKPIFHNNLALWFQEKVQIAAGVCRPKMKDGEPVVDDAGEPLLEGLYSLHDFRHAAASLWFDTYGHLFDELEDDAEVVAALEAGVFGAA